MCARALLNGFNLPIWPANLRFVSISRLPSYKVG
jgi:hypothetical protein